MKIKVNIEHYNEMICQGVLDSFDKAYEFAETLTDNGIDENKIFFEFEVEE